MENVNAAEFIKLEEKKTILKNWIYWVTLFFGLEKSLHGFTLFYFYLQLLVQTQAWYFPNDFSIMYFYVQFLVVIGAIGNYWFEEMRDREGGSDPPGHLCQTQHVWAGDRASTTKRGGRHIGQQDIQHHDIHQVSAGFSSCTNHKENCQILILIQV